MNIDWSKLESCGSSADATNMPDAIALLFSSDENERQKGYWGIDNHAVVQSDLYSSAPYAARAIVDRFLADKVVTREFLNILFELHNGHGPQILNVGPLARESIENLCKKIVQETEPVLIGQMNRLNCELAEEVNALIESFNEQNI